MLAQRDRARIDRGSQFCQCQFNIWRYHDKKYRQSHRMTVKRLMPLAANKGNLTAQNVSCRC